MHLYKKFQIIQLLVICLTIFIGFKNCKKANSPERKFILPFCISECIILSVAIYNYLNNSFPTYLYFLVVIFSWCEIFFLSFYICSIINKKHNILIPISINIICPLVSMMTFNNPTLIPMVASNVYISLFIFWYFKWLFTNKYIFNL